MSRSVRTGRRRQRRRGRYMGGEDVNPMNYLSNLSDVMLILAVGIMLALILHWNVEISTDQSAQSTSKQAVTFSEDDLQGTEKMPESAEQMGSVYYDPETGKYYYQIDGN